MNNKHETRLKLLFVFSFILLCGLILVKVRPVPPQLRQPLTMIQKYIGRIWKTAVSGAQILTAAR